MTQTEALKIADDLDSEFAQGRISNHTGRKAAQMLRALAQPEQETAWYHAECNDPDHSGFFKEAIDAVTQVNEHGGFVTKLYTTPPQRNPLTDEQIKEITLQIGWTQLSADDLKFCRAIEAAHGIKE